MSLTQIIEPKVFAAYVRERVAEKSDIVKSGAVYSSGALSNLASGGGRTVSMPFWNRVSGESEVLSFTTPLTPSPVTANADSAAIHYRGKAWGAFELGSALAGDSAAGAVADMVADYWVREEQKILVATLGGVFGAAGMSGHVFGASSPSVINAQMVLNAKQLLGDSFGQLRVIVMHSAVYTSLQKQDLITFLRPSTGAKLGEYLGYSVVVDDSVRVATGGVYSTYLLAEGAFGRGDGNPSDYTEIEVCRDGLKGIDYLIIRKALILHPFGIAFTGNNVTGISPTNTELRNPLNWNRVYDSKNIGMIEIKHTVA
jgi:hypothetical protein